MSNPTSNFGWQMPTTTDLVTDLPADFEVFGQAVDTDFADLLGGTTGQILSKTSNTDLDFTWTSATAGDVTGVTAGTGITVTDPTGPVPTVTNSMATAITTAGDLIKGTGSGTFDRLGIGSAGQVLTVSAGAPAWATPAGGGKVLQVIAAYTNTAVSNSTTTFTDTGLTATITPTLNTSKVLVLVGQSGVARTATNQYQGVDLRLLAGGTNISNFQYLAGTTDTTLFQNGQVSTAFLHSPATTSAVIYKTQFAAGQNEASVTTQYLSSNSSIILLEIGA
jgi:hypothetical protein